MAKLYVTANTDAIKTLRTARGHHWAKATVQSYEGSVQVTLDEAGNVELFVEQGSTAIPSYCILRTTLKELLHTHAFPQLPKSA